MWVYCLPIPHMQAALAAAWGTTPGGLRRSWQKRLLYFFPRPALSFQRHSFMAAVLLSIFEDPGPQIQRRRCKAGPISHFLILTDRKLFKRATLLSTHAEDCPSILTRYRGTNRFSCPPL